MQDNARFVGADLTVDVDINKYVGAFFNGDIVKAKLEAGDIPYGQIEKDRSYCLRRSEAAARLSRKEI